MYLRLLQIINLNNSTKTTLLSGFFYYITPIVIDTRIGLESFIWLLEFSKGSKKIGT
jgi:hypothetical protein